ncbi:peptidoglycan editing factor PgeF [Gayadomonas joobiniege]|uniref:peptidoglycan editing factor PgeF n=1 Tax=Gayadomonas joobiniege TaxID=1234606 RepID=UPI000368BC04
MYNYSSFVPDWPVPANVKSIQTTRKGGCSAGPYRGFNLALHVGDEPEIVAKNRQQLPHFQHIHWLEQVHGVKTLLVEAAPLSLTQADGSYTFAPTQVCAVMTADCLPILLSNRNGDFVAALHCGWRGLAAGIIKHQLQQLALPNEGMLAWLGPAIGPAAFEVGSEVKQAFLQKSTQFETAFNVKSGEKFNADLYKIAKIQLNQLGVMDIFSQHECTYQQADKYFSYRRDGQTGRQASLIWLDKKA